MKSPENSFETPIKVPFKLDKTRKPLFPQVGTKLFYRKTSDVFLSENVA